MNQDIKYDIFFMPGMAANPKIFEFIKLPVNFKIHHLEWKMPIKNESISDYALRISTPIKGKNIIIIGVSFGGILVQEISKIIDCTKVIIISSVKSNKELPLLMQIGKKTKEYKFFNIKWIQDFESLALFVFGPIVKNRIELYRKYLSVREEIYLKWSIHQIVNWEQTKPIKDIVHIHGTNAVSYTHLTLPTKRIV